MFREKYFKKTRLKPVRLCRQKSNWNLEFPKDWSPNDCAKKENYSLQKKITWSQVQPGKSKWRGAASAFLFILNKMGNLPVSFTAWLMRKGITFCYELPKFCCSEASVLHCCSAETFILLTSCLRFQYRTSAGDGEGGNLDVYLVDFFNQRLHSLLVIILKRKVVF